MPSRTTNVAALSVLLALVACRSPAPEQSKQPPATSIETASVPTGVWTLELTDGASATIRKKGTKVVTYDYRFWGVDWTWAQPEISEKSDDEGAKSFRIEVPDLAITIDGKAEATDSAGITFTFDIEARRELDSIVGGGLEFSIETDEIGEPVLLSDDRGWRIPAEGESSVAVTFEPAAAALYFERGDKNRLRAMLFGDHIDAGRHRVVMRMRLPTGGRVLPSIATRYGQPDPRTWHAATLAWDRWPIDVSFLNASDRPAGKHGRVHAKDGALAFEDGTEARFWGTNLAAYALFSDDKAQVQRQAKRLAAFGFNLVRIHHHDSHWVDPNVFASKATTRTLDDASLDRIDWWVKCLQQEGIYVWIDLHVGRPFAAADGIGDYQEIARSADHGKGFNYVNPDIEARMNEFARQYLGRTNRYTGRKYTDDPGIVGVLVTNENDITHHFGNLFNPDSDFAAHRKRYVALAERFAKKAGIELEQFEPWRPGANKIVLTQIEASFGRRSIAALRRLGYDGPAATTNFWGDNRLWALPALTVGDLIDVHAYGGSEHIGVDPHHEANFVARIASAQVANMPLSISEWNVPAPARGRFTAPLYLASIAALQGWDAPMFYVYLQNPLEPPAQPTQWSSFDDAALMATMPAAAVAYRRGDVRPAQKSVRLKLDKEQIYARDTTALTSVAMRTLYEQSRLEIGLPDLPELDWDGAPPLAEGTEVVTELDHSFLAEDATVVVSDTDELRRDFAQGIHTIDTARTQVASGWIGGQRIELGDVTFEIRTPKATVAVTSLDGVPISESKRMLVTAIAQVEPSPGGRLPLLAQPVEGRISLEHAAKSLQLIPQMGAASVAVVAPPIPSRRKGRRHAFDVPSRVPTHWFVIVPAAGPAD